MLDVYGITWNTVWPESPFFCLVIKYAFDIACNSCQLPQRSLHERTNLVITQSRTGPTHVTELMISPFGFEGILALYENSGEEQIFPVKKELRGIG
jgi:hypothetical protein